MERSGINIFIAAAVVVLAILCLFKFMSIQRVKGDIARLEIELSRGQELWNRYPPLSAAQRKDLEATQRRLFQMLPREKEIPSILEEIAGLARNNNLVEISFATGDGAAPGAPPPGISPGAAVAAQAPGAKPPAPGAILATDFGLRSHRHIFFLSRRLRLFPLSPGSHRLRQRFFWRDPGEPLRARVVERDADKGQERDREYPLPPVHHLVAAESSPF